MATTETAICNHALLMNGNSAITSLSENSTEATYCRQFYASARQEVLRAFPWNFAVKTALLSEALDDAGDAITSSQWEYVYQIPADCLYVMSVQPEDSFVDGSQKIEHEVIGNYLMTNEGDAWVKYVYDCKDASLFDPMFASALSHRMAAYISMPIHRDANYTQMLFNLYLKIVTQAQVASSNENQHVPVVGRTFINARS